MYMVVAQNFDNRWHILGKDLFETIGEAEQLKKDAMAGSNVETKTGYKEVRVVELPYPENKVAALAEAVVAADDKAG